MPAIEIDAGDFGRQQWQFARDFLDKFGRQHLVGVEPHDPFGLDRQIVERPLELLGLIDEFVLKDVSAGAARDFDGAIRGK